MFSPLNPGTHVLLKNFMSSNYCFTAVPHRAFSIYIVISRTALLSCNWIRKHTLYPTDWSGSQGFVLLCEVMTRGGEKENVFFHPENKLSPWETPWSMHNSRNKRVSSTLSDKSCWICTVEAAKVIFPLVSPGYVLQTAGHNQLKQCHAEKGDLNPPGFRRRLKLNNRRQTLHMVHLSLSLTPLQVRE